MAAEDREGLEVIIDLDEEETGDKGAREEGKHEPAIDSPRWKEVYKKYKDGEREIADLKEKLQSMEGRPNQSEALLEHNRQLAEAIEKLSSTLDKSSEADVLGSLEDKLAELRADKRKAREALDYDKEDALDEQIYQLRDQIKEAKIKKPVSEKKEKPADPNSSQPGQGDFAAWAKDNPWYNNDPKMQRFANLMDDKLLHDPDWFDKPFRERLDEVAKLTKEKFGLARPNSRRTASDVEGGGFRLGANNGTKVTLSPEELKAARIAGIEPEEYAKQKQIIEKARGL